MSAEIIKQLEGYSSTSRKKSNEYFFKTKEGQYSSHDIFIGISSPDIRKTVKTHFKTVSFHEIQSLLKSPIHEYRMTGLLFLVYQYPKADTTTKKNIFNFYFKHLNSVNNWDLVDCSTPHILGQYLLENFSDRKIQTKIKKLALSKNLWERRISILAGFPLIKSKSFVYPFSIMSLLLRDKEDLIRKALGWMLREVYKKDTKIAEDFIKKNYSKISRTSLRYAIEKMPPHKRKKYLSGNI